VKTAKESEEMMKNFKQRVNHAILSLKDENYKVPSRTSTPNLMRRTLISAGFLNENERVTQAESRNKWLDSSPNGPGLRLRPRQKSKEIQPVMRINLKNEQERVKSSILQQKQVFDSSEPPQSSCRSSYKNYDGLEKPRFIGGKQVLDYYHVKTYFKTIESIALDLHSSTRNMSRSQIKKKNDDEKLGMNEGKIRPKTIEREEIPREDLRPCGEQVLEKYGYWKSRKEYSKRDNSGFIQKSKA
jgi:hypothetical protein